MNNKRKYNRKQLGWGGAGSGAVSGAGTGAAFGPWGAVIGGVVGGVAGHFSEEQQKESEGQDNSIGQAASMTQSAIGIAGTLKGRGNISQQQGQIINPPPTSQPLVAQQVRINPNNPNQHLGTPIQYAMGGNTKLSEFNNGGTHEENPNGGIPIGQNASVEQGETKWQDYIFSDRISTGNKKETFADASKKIQKKYTRENDAPSQKALEREMKALMNQQEMFRQELGMTSETQMANGGRIQYPDGGTLPSSTPTYGGASIGTDSKGRSVYDPAKVRPKVREYFEANPSLFVAVGPPKMESGNIADKDAIMKSLNSSKPVSQTPSSIPMDNLKWIKEPSIKGWMQAKDKAGKNIYQRTDELGRRVGPIEYAMGGRIKMNNGGIDPNSFLALNQTLNPNLGNLGQASIPVPNAPIEEEYVAPTIYDTTPVETVRRTFSSDPTSNNNLARTEFSGTEHPSFEVPATQMAKTESPTNNTNTVNTTTPNNVPDSDLEGTKQKGTSGFDKYDALTMGAQLLPAMYNIGQGLRKQKPVDLGRMTPNLVNYDSSRKASEDSFNQQANILNESIRENATSSGQALSNRVAFANRAAQDRSLQLGQINEREYNTNQQIRGNADQVNLQIRANEEQIDAQNKGISQTAVGMGLAQVGQAAGTINRDRNLRNTERETIGMIGQGSDFGIEYDEDGNPVIRFKNRKNTTPTTGKK